MKEYQSCNNHILLQLLSEGDESAFTEIYNRFWKKLFSVAYSRLKTSQEAEDVVHDVFSSLWINRTKVKIESLEQYLATATKYIVLARLKKRVLEKMYNQTLQQAPVMDMPFEAALHYKRILEIVSDEVEKLPERCRLVFKYSRYKGMPVREIAHELNISPKTVENQLNKALKHLRVATRSFLNFCIMLYAACPF